MESPTSIALVLDLPGVTKEGVTIRMDGNVLCIDAERKGYKPEGFTETVAGGKQTYRFQVRTPVSTEGVKAQLRDGVLTVIMPKSGTRGHAIPVE